MKSVWKLIDDVCRESSKLRAEFEDDISFTYADLKRKEAKYIALLKEVLRSNMKQAEEWKNGTGE